MKRRARRFGATPIEEAPIWMLGIVVVLLWLVVFPALVGLLNGFALVAGGGQGIALAAAAIALLVVLGLARQRPWKRPGSEARSDARPFFARFSTWLIASLLVPNVIYGIVILAGGGEGLDYVSAGLLGLLVSALHGAFAPLERGNGRLADRDPPIIY